jgi:hypothetical protein
MPGGPDADQGRHLPEADQLDALRIASGSGALLPVCVSIQTTTTLPSEYSFESSCWSTSA